MIGALRVSLSAETAQFEAGMKRAQKTAYGTRSAFQKSFGGLGGIVKAGLAGVVSGLSIGLIIQGTKAALNYAGSLAEVGQQLGVTTKDLQVFRYAAGQVGVKQEQLETGLSKLTITLGKVAAGAKAPAQALAAIGISVDQLKGKDTGEAFRIIADGLQKVTDRSQRAAVEVALFGKSGAMLDNLLSGGSGAINGLALAAEKLGIVLSDEQIAKADETADKLDAVKTVLASQIAGVVADNAQAIIGLADSLAYLVAQAAQAASKMTAFYRSIAIDSARFVSAHPTLAKVAFGTKGSEAILRAGAGAIRSNVSDRTPAKTAARAPTGGANVGQFLAGGAGGGGRKGRAKADTSERDAQRAAQDAQQFDQELLRGQMDILRARQDLSISATHRADLERQMLDLEKASLESEMSYKVQSGELTKGQADQILEQQAQVDSLRRQTIDQQEAARLTHDRAELTQTDYDIQLEKLELESNLAQTSREKRDVELRILDAMQAQEKARLEAVIADQQSSDLAKQEAQKRLSALNDTFAARQQGAIQGTRGPMEEWQANAMNTTDALESLKVQGIEGAVDALSHLTEGFGSFRDAAVSAIKDVLAQLIRMQLMKMAANLFGSLGGGSGLSGFGGVASSNLSALNAIPMNVPSLGFANGGSFNVMGRSGIDNNVMSINGLPIAKVSHGERVSISNEGGRSGGGHRLTQNFYGAVSRETAMQAGVKARQGIAQANRKGG